MHLFANRRRSQAGQAIVLMALGILALIGFLGLTIDGGRVYIDRRELQAAADSAALAMADKFVTSQDMTTSEKAGAAVFAENARISGTPSATWCGNPPTPPASSPPFATCPVTITWPGDSHQLTLTYVDKRGANEGIYITSSASDSLAVAFMQVLGVGPTVSVGAAAATAVYDQSDTPAILTLAAGPCDGTSASSLTVQGGNGLTVTVVGQVYSDGGIGIGNGANLDVIGNAYEHCGALPIPGITNTNFSEYSPVAPINIQYVGGSTLPASQMYQTSESWPAQNGNVDVYPGQYNSDPGITGGTPCYFANPGQYYWNQGFSVTKGFISNELRPPDEATYYDQTVRAGAPPSGSPPGTTGDSNYMQLWHANSTTCDGMFQVSPVVSTGHALTPSSPWGFVVTAGRQDVYYPDGHDPVFYLRESSPSMCRTANANGSNSGFQAAVSNVPGAQWYNVYATSIGCSSGGSNVPLSSFGYLGSFCSGENPPQMPVGVTWPSTGCSGSFYMSNSKTSCPNLPSWSAGSPPPALTPGVNQNSGTCTLGYAISQIFDSQNVVGFNPSGTACSVTAAPGAPDPQGCAPPDAELCPAGATACITLAPNAPAAQNSPTVGDRANEDQCDNNVGSNVGCPGTVTPGAVQFVFNNNVKSCMAQSGSGGVWVFSGKQYNWLAVYSTNSTCTGANANSVAGGSATSYKGTFYMPYSSVTLSGGGQNAVASQVIALYCTIDGSSGVTIAYNPRYAAVPPAGRLVL